MLNVRCKHSAILICTCDLDTIIISDDFDIKSVLVIVREKPVRVFVRRGLTRYLLFRKVFNFKINMVEVSHAGFTRLIRVLFLLYNTRIRPSIFRLEDGPLGAFRRRAGCCQGVFM